MFNKIILMGRIAQEPELKTTPNDVKVCSFSIAVDRRYQVKGEEKKTDFFNIETWRSTAEFVANYFKKGSMILIEGELQTQKYTDKNGNPATWYKVVADRASFTGEKRDDVSASGYQAQPPQNCRTQYGNSASAAQAQNYQQPAPSAASYQAAQNYRQAEMAAIAGKYAGTTQPAPNYQELYGNSAPAAQTGYSGTDDNYPF